MNLKFWQKKEKEENKKPKSKSREWIDAIVFAVVAATLIRFFNHGGIYNTHAFDGKISIGG